MNSRTLAIYDTESGYAKGLLQYINGKQNIPFKTVCFTNRELLVEYLEDNKPDVLLIAAEEMSMEIDKSSAKKIILLSRGVTSIILIHIYLQISINGINYKKYIRNFGR
ncbi:MAG: hypothetical protein ACLT2Z_03065 [Eubacterium sp.]